MSQPSARNSSKIATDNANHTLRYVYKLDRSLYAWSFKFWYRRFPVSLERMLNDIYRVGTQIQDDIYTAEVRAAQLTNKATSSLFFAVREM